MMDFSFFFSQKKNIIIRIFLLFVRRKVNDNHEYPTGKLIECCIHTRYIHIMTFYYTYIKPALHMIYSMCCQCATYYILYSIYLYHIYTNNSNHFFIFFLSQKDAVCFPIQYNFCQYKFPIKVKTCLTLCAYMRNTI